MLKAIKNQKSVSSTLWLLRLGWFCAEFMLITPIIVLIYVNKGITVGDFFLIQGLFRVAAFLFEVPSGYLSDRFSRRKVLILGSIIQFLGYATLAMSHGFWQIVLGEALLGVACALFSGTLEAYTYDLLKRNNTQKHFLKEYGSITTFGMTASFIASMLGGVLYAYTGGDFLLWIMVLFGIIQTVLYLFIPELLEVKRRKAKNKTAFADAIGITYTTLKDHKLRNFILFPAFFGGFTIILLWIMQPLMESSGVPLTLFGLFFGINQFSAIIFAKYAYKICEKLGELRVSLLTIWSLIIGILLSFVALNTNNIIMVYISCGLMYIVPSIRILNNLQYNTLIHNDISSQKRGTVLSTRAMVSTLFGAAMLTAAKLLLDNYGIQTTMIFTFVMTIILFISLHSVKKYLKKE
jgi:MFS family permease